MMFTIVITAYKRANSLERLLNSLISTYEIDEKINLIISLEAESSDSVITLAKQFEWELGMKEIIQHEKKMGLINHFIWAGDRCLDLGVVLFLEEDAVVSPVIFKQLEKMIPFYENDEEIAGISLYSNPSNELTLKIFEQVEDGNDVYFFQHPYMGNVWYPKKWKKFAEWYKTYIPNKSNVPEKIADWDQSFKRIFIQYLVENNLFMVYPRCSLVSDSADGGLHVTNRKDTKAKLQCAYKPMKLVHIQDSLSVYDAFGEIDVDVLKRVNPELREYDFVCDINCQKKYESNTIVLTNRRVRKSILTYDDCYKPMEVAALLNYHGNGLSLAFARDIVESRQKYLNRCQYEDIIHHYPIRKRTIIELAKDKFLKIRNLRR